MRILKSLTASLTALAALGMAVSLQAAPIGVKFVGRDIQAPAFNPADTAGLVPQANWNQTAAGDPPFNVSNLPLMDGSGAATTVTLTYAANDCWHSDGPKVTPDDRLMFGVVKINADQPGRTVDFVFKGLDTTKVYDVYTYMDVNNGPTAINVAIAGTTFYVTEPNPWGGSFVQAVNTDPRGTRDQGNYVKAEAVANASGQLTVSGIYVSGGDGLGIAAIQLVPLDSQPAPGLVKASANGLYAVKADFDHALDPATVVPANFSLASVDHGAIAVKSAQVLVGGRTVLLGTEALTPDDFDVFTLTASADIKSKLGTSPSGPQTMDFQVIKDNLVPISVNMVGGYDASHPAVPLDPTDLAGVVALTNWNNAERLAYLALNDSDGAPTPVTITFAANGSWYNDGNNGVIGGTPGDQKLIRGVFEATETSRDVPFILHNVPQASYNLIAVTVLDDGKQDGNVNPYNGELWWVNGDYANRIKVNSQWGGNFFQNSTGWIRGVGQYNMECNYVQFDDVQPVEGTIRLDLQSDTFRGRINGLQLIPIAPVAMTILAQPASTNVYVALPYQFTVNVSDLRKPYSGQWFSNGVAVAGATTPTISGIASVSGDGAQFYYAVTNPVNFVVSDVATLTVRAEASPLSVSSMGNPHAAYLNFNIPMNLDGTYTMICSNQITFEVTPVVLGTKAYGSSQLQVVLPVSPDLVPDSNTYIVTITGATAQNGFPLGPDPIEVAFVHGSDYPAFQTMYRVYDLPLSSFGNYPPAFLQTSPSYNVPGKYRQTINPTAAFDTANSFAFVADNYAGDLFGWFKAPVAGNYTFWMSSDDRGLTYLSTDANPAHKVQINNEPVWADWRQWKDAHDGNANRGTPPSNGSAPIPLVADQLVYLEGVFSQGGGGQGYTGTYTVDNTSAPDNGTTALPLSSFVQRRMYTNNVAFDTLGNVYFTKPVGTQIGYSTLTVTFNAAVDGTPGWAPKVGYWYQWSRNGVPIVGATNASYTTAPLNVANDGDLYMCCASNNFSSACDTGTVSVSPSPVLLSASTLNQSDTITLVYTVPVFTNGTFLLTNSANDFEIVVTIVGYGSASNIVILQAAEPIAANSVSGLTVSDVTAADGTSMIHPNPTYISFGQGAPGMQTVDFTTLPANAVLNGTAALNADGSLHLTEAVNDQQGSIVFTVGKPVAGFKVNYKLLMGDSTGGFADGTSFSFGNNVDGSFGEGGSGSGLTVTFQTYSPNFRGFRILWNGAEKARQLFDFAQFATPAVYKDVAIEMTTDGYVTVIYGGIVIWNGFKIDTFAPITGNAKFGIGGRCGGENEKNYIDDLRFNDYPIGEPVAVSMTPGNQTLAECSTVTYTSTVTGSPNATRQWFRNGVAIPGAVGPSYTTPKLFCPADNGVVYSVKATVDLNVFTASSTVMLNCDYVAPSLVSAGSTAGQRIGAQFSEEVDPAAATNALNYSINGEPFGDNIAGITMMPVYNKGAVIITLSNTLTSAFTLTATNMVEVCPAHNSTNSTVAGTIFNASLQAINLGLAIPAGLSASFTNDDVVITGGGADIWGTSDECRFVYTERAGDFDMKVQVTRLDPTSKWAKAGLDARVLLTADSPHAMSVFTPYGTVVPPSVDSPGADGIDAGIRTTVGGNTDWWGILGNGSYGGWGAPVLSVGINWMRLVRTGDNLKSYHSTNGVDWVIHADTATGLCGSLPPSLFVGMVESSHNNGAGAAAVFKNFSLTPPGVYVPHTSCGSVAVSYDGAAHVTLNWADACCRLQGATELNSNPALTVWTDIPGLSPVTLPSGSPMQFFRTISP